MVCRSAQRKNKDGNKNAIDAGQKYKNCADHVAKNCILIFHRCGDLRGTELAGHLLPTKNSRKQDTEKKRANIGFFHRFVVGQKKAFLP